MEDKKIKTKAQKITELTDMLPDACASFLLETGTEKAVSTRFAYAWELKQFFEYMMSVSPDLCLYQSAKDITIQDIGRITSQDISRYLTRYRDSANVRNRTCTGDTNHAERTVARKRAALSSFFNYLVANRKIEFNPVLAAAKVKIHLSDEVNYINMSEQREFLKAIETGDRLTKTQKVYHDRYSLRDHALVLFLLDTGMRVSELHGVCIQDLDLDECSVFIVRKGGNKQTLYYGDQTAEALREYISERKMNFPLTGREDPLFITMNGSRLSVRAIEVLVKKYAESTFPGRGQHLSPHKMRSSFAMEYYKETKDILAVSKKLGHKDVSITSQYYAKATKEQMKDTRNILDEKR